MTDNDSRIAVLEVKQAYTESTLESAVEQLKALNENMVMLNTSMSRYRGMGAALLFTASIIGGVASFIISIWLKVK